MFVDNDLLVMPVYLVIEAKIRTNSYALQRCQMVVMPSRITKQPSVCSTASSDKQHINIKGPHYRPFVRRIERLRMDSYHSGTVTHSMFAFDDVVMQSVTHFINTANMRDWIA